MKLEEINQNLMRPNPRMLVQHIKVGDMVVHTGGLCAATPSIANFEEFTNEEQHIILVVGVGGNSTHVVGISPLCSSEEERHIPLLYTKNSYANLRDRYIMLIGFLRDRLYRIYTSSGNLGPLDVSSPL